MKRAASDLNRISPFNHKRIKHLTSATHLMLAALICIATCSTNAVSAQGIYQNWGLAKDGGPDGLGVIFSTDTTGSILTGHYSFSYLNNGMTPMGTMTAERATMNR